MGRKWLEECCCVTESLYTYDAAYTPTATNDRFDVKANAVELARPIYGQGEAIYYASASPPTGYHLESVARVKVWDQIEATLTAKLVPRPMQQDWFPLASWNYDPNSTATIVGWGPTAATIHLGGTGYQLDVNDLITPAAAFYFGTSYTVLEGFTDFPEPAGDGYPAHPGTTLSQLSAPARDGMKDIVLYCFDMSLQTRPTTNITDGGWVSSQFPPNYPNSNNDFPMQVNGFDSSFFMSMEGQSRWVVCTSNHSPGNAVNYYGPQESIQPGRRKRAWLTLYVATYLPNSPAGDTTEPVFVTAYTQRPNRLVSVPNTGRSRITAQYPAVFCEVVHEDTRNANAYGNYTNTTVKQFKGTEVSVYKNGTLVLQATYPTVEASRSVTQDEGTYFIVNEITGATDDPSTPAWYPRTPQQHKFFDCVVVDKTPPVVAFEPTNDFYGSSSVGWAFQGKILATELLYYFRGDVGVVLDNKGVRIKGITQSLVGSGIGPPTRTLTVHPALLFDMAGNAAAAVMSQSVTIHAIPTNGLLGAAATLQRYESRTRTQAERIETVRLSFDRRINPETINVSQFTLSKNNQPIGGLSIEPMGDGGYSWLVNIPLEVQTQRSFFLLTFNPGGTVLTDDVIVQREGSRSAFPTTGAYRTKYVYTDENGVDQWFSWSRTGYVSIPEGTPPLSPNGVRYDPEPCRLAARTAWLMADENGSPQMIDCGRIRRPVLGRIASIGVSKTIDTTRTHSEAQSNEPGMPAFSVDPRDARNVYGRDGEIRFKRYENRRSFIPCVPAASSPRAGCSWFGLWTTIDPAPPAAVHECAAPSEHQKHSSVIMSNDEITGFVVSLEMRDGSGNIVSNPPDDAWGYNLSYDIYNPGDAARKLMAIGGYEYTFINSLQGRQLSQNVWSCIDGSRSAEYRSQLVTTQQPETCSSNGQKYYRYRMTENGGTVFRRGSRGGKMRTARAVFTQDGFQGTIEATRDCWTFGSLLTTTLEDLVFSFSFRMAVKRATTYTEYGVSGSPVGYVQQSYGLDLGVCPDYLAQPGIFSNASSIAVFHESQMQQIGQPREVVGRYFDYVSGAFALSKLEEIALVNGQTITKEPFVAYTAVGSYQSQRIWTIKIRRA